MRLNPGEAVLAEDEQILHVNRQRDGSQNSIMREWDRRLKSGTGLTSRDRSLILRT